MSTENSLKHFYRPPKAEFEKLLGLEVIKVTQDFALLRLPFKKDFTNPHNSLHGGAIVSLADTASAIALSIRYEDARFLTTRFNIEFKNQAKTDCFAEARIKSHKKTLYFIETEIYDIDKKLVAKAEATFFVPNKII
jgi:acyl-CoA thioesterase